MNCNLKPFRLSGHCGILGVSTTIATGKIYPSVDYLIAPLCGDLPFLVAHGSIVQDQKGNVLMRQGLLPEVMEYLRRTSEKYHCDICAYLADGILAREFNHNMKYLTEYWEPKAEEVATWPDLGERSTML